GGMPDATLTSNAQPGYQGTASDPDGNVTSLQASVDGGPFSSAGTSCQGCLSGAPLAGPVSWAWEAPQRLADGTHTVALQAVDNAGGLSPAVTRTVSIDTVPPRFTGLQAAGGSTTLAVAFSKPLVCASVAPAAFSVNSGSAPQGAGPVPEGAPQGAGSIRGGRSLGVAAVSCDGVTATAVHLTLANPPRGGDQVALSVAASTGGPADQAGNNIGDPRMVSATATNVGPSASVTGGIPD